MIFFVPYVIFAPPVAILGKRFGPARVLPILMFIFGSMTLLAAAADNFGGMFALRFFLGMAESGFFPLVIYYLTTFYRRGELARRLAVFYAASNIANAFVSITPWVSRLPLLTRAVRPAVLRRLPHPLQHLRMALPLHHRRRRLGPFRHLRILVPPPLGLRSALPQPR